MDAPTWISIITGIVSIALAIVSLVISFVFYKWSANSNEEMKTISQSITERTEYLGKLFDKMFDSTFSLVKADSEAMRHHLFKSSEVVMVSENEADKTIDVLSFVKNESKTKQEIIDYLSISENILTPILTKMCDNHLILENEGRYHFCNSTQNNTESSD